MNTPSSLVAVALFVAAAGAQASNVSWSIGIQAPLGPGVNVGTVVSNAPVYSPAPVIYAPPPVVAAPVYVQPAPVYYVPRPVYYPARVVYRPVWVAPGYARVSWTHGYPYPHGGYYHHR